MTRPSVGERKQSRPATAPVAQPAASPAQIAHLADRVLAGDIVPTVSIAELCALLTELKARGLSLKPRTEWEQTANPWLLIVVPLVNHPVEAV